MSTKKAIGDSFAAIFILLISQLIAQGIATAFGLIKVPVRSLQYNCGGFICRIGVCFP